MKAAALLSSGLLFVQQPTMAPRPPEQFTGNDGQMIGIAYADPATVNSVCQELMKRNPPDQRLGPGWTIYACTNITTRRSLLPDPCGPEYAGESFAATACHEKGHANGWGWEYG